ncbi:hypothetical protein BCS42_11005 [Crenothrix sp. D3]|nr:hypothetical protein BCS42_11005 [Crenothrix sp. D3]
MEALVRTLEGTLDGSVDYYNIPLYQRPYTWSKDNFTTLWDDLFEAHKNYTTAKETEKQIEFYFLGPVVFVENKDKDKDNYDIIDGQQRITTFHIIIWYLYHKITDETDEGEEERSRLRKILTHLAGGTKTKLKVSSGDTSTFNNIKDNKDIDEKSKMKDCALFFKDKVENLQDPESFSKFLRKYTQFIVITAEDYGKAWDLFIGLNGKGVSLNPTDLVKAHVCGYSDIGDDVAIIWQKRIEPLKKESTAYLLFLTRFKANRFVSENNLFKEFSKIFPEKISVSDIDRYSNIFQCFWNTSIENIPEKIDDIKLSPKAQRSLRVLRDLKRKDFTTLIFKYADAFGIKSIFDEDFLKLMASYQIRMAISKERIRERKFVDEFKEMEFTSKPQILLEIAKFLKSDAPDDKFEKAVKNADYSNKSVRILLQHKEEGDIVNIKISNFDLEHLMPQTGTNEWYEMAGVVDENGKEDKDNYTSIVNNIGNLFLIDKNTNSKVKNFSFNIKKSFYQGKELNHLSIKAETADKIDWKSSDIEKRASEIAAWAKSYWTL